MDGWGSVVLLARVLGMALVVCGHSLCAGTRCVRALVVCGHSLCAGTRCVRALVVCGHSLCATQTIWTIGANYDLKNGDIFFSLM
jgi:hypothetical protein